LDISAGPSSASCRKLAPIDPSLGIATGSGVSVRGEDADSDEAGVVAALAEEPSWTKPTEPGSGIASPVFEKGEPVS